LKLGLLVRKDPENLVHQGNECPNELFVGVGNASFEDAEEVVEVG
jgi:hypothetical protein